MPENMLKNMLDSLCRNGVKFHNNFTGRSSGNQRNLETIMNSFSADAGFADDVPGGNYFDPAAEGLHPYYPPEQHSSHVEIIMLNSGSVDFFINNKWHLLEDNSVHVLLRNTLHTERHFKQMPYSLCWLSCLPSSLTLHRTTYSPENGYRQSACRMVISPPMANQLWECGAARQIDETHYFALLVQCLDFAVESGFSQPGTDYHAVLLSQIRKYLDENFFRPVALEEVARMAHCSVVHLNRTFAARYGTTIHRYLTEKRLQEAAKLLKKGLAPGVTAKKSGFADQRYFSRLFRKNFGKTPSQFASGKQISS